MTVQTIQKGWTLFHRFTWAVFAAGFVIGVAVGAYIFGG